MRAQVQSIEQLKFAGGHSWGIGKGPGRSKSGGRGEVGCPARKTWDYINSKLARERKMNGEERETRKWKQSGAVRVLASQHKLADPNALLLHTFEQAPGPNKFSGEDTQGQSDDEPSRTGSNQHDDANQEERKAENYFQHSLCLLKSLDQHLSNLIVKPAPAISKSLIETWRTLLDASNELRGSSLHAHFHLHNSCSFRRLC